MSVVGLRKSSRFTSVAVQTSRSIWWGHDTLEDQLQRKAKKSEKDVIAWSRPGENLAEKEEYTWVPARAKAEADMTRTSIFNKWTGAVETISYLSRYQWRPRWINAYVDPEKYMEQSIQHSYAVLVAQQEFVAERLLALGPDLAAAQFLCHRGCRVRFRGHKHWTELVKGKVDIPDMYVKGWFIEAIDASQANLVYEGLQNLRNLHYIKYLDISYCDFMNEWCMDRISGEYADTLEYLDISGCRKINTNSLEVLWRFKNLKTLVLKDMGHVEDLSLVCLMLLDVNPKLKIVGAEYMDLKLLEGTEHQDLLSEDYIPNLPQLPGSGADMATENINISQDKPERAESRS